LFGLHIGDKMLFRSVCFKIQYKPNKWEHIGMIAGGTGFTPMLQVIRHSLTEPLEPGVVDRTKLSFLFCNRSERHVLLKGLFDQLAQQHPDRFRMFYAVDEARDPAKWAGYTGYVTKKMIQETMPGPSEPNSLIMICGPDHLLHHVAGSNMYLLNTMSGSAAIQPFAPDIGNLDRVGGVLGELGYDSSKVYRF